MKIYTFGLSIVKLVQLVNSLPSFQSQIPNGDNVYYGGEQWPGVGHVNRAGAGDLNPFGQRLKELGISNGNFVWADVCWEDSDEDGMSNGEELGDPNCVWTVGDDPARTTDITHPGYSEDEETVTEVLSNQDDSVPILITLHAVLMCLAWVIFAPMGILVALVHKKTSVQPSYLPLHWFKMHQIFVVLAVLCTLIAFICIAVELEEVEFDTDHKLSGIGVVVLAVLQPVSGILRPHLPAKGEAKSKFRLLWEFLHQWLGRSLLLLAILALYYGFETFSEDYGYMEENAATALSYMFWGLFALGTLFSVVFVLFFRERYLPAATTAESKSSTQPKVTQADIEKLDSEKKAQADNQKVQLT
eukprot:snap_masked-scaffold_13-processed-gene-2.19-mRNA-1 protein AED:0.31 eAED:0.32 QI:0/-1/0/1/-1/1/1/0/358